MKRVFLMIERCGKAAFQERDRAQAGKNIAGSF